MFSMTINKELDEVQRQDADVNRRYYGEDVKFYRFAIHSSFLYICKVFKFFISCDFCHASLVPFFILILSFSLTFMVSYSL